MVILPQSRTGQLAGFKSHRIVEMKNYAVSKTPVKLQVMCNFLTLNLSRSKDRVFVDPELLDNLFFGYKMRK